MNTQRVGCVRETLEEMGINIELSDDTNCHPKNIQ